MHNVLAHAGRSVRRVVSAFIATTFAQDDAEQAKAQWRLVAGQLGITPQSLSRAFAALRPLGISSGGR